jgi:hypothetical protein
MARDPDHDRIAHKAHELWEAEGRPHGRDQEHWDQARELVAIEDSQGDTLLPRDTGAEAPVEEPEEALRNLADMPNLTDQGENLLTSTDREPSLVATPSGRRGRMPKAEVPTSDQPGVPAKSRKSAAKPAPAAKAKSAAKADAKSDKPKPAAKADKPSKGAAHATTSAGDAQESAQPKTASVPKASVTDEAATQEEFSPRRGGRRRKAE